MHANSLAEETSPYLQQHAHNPVDWYPWNEVALNKAKKENKPILLSIGYLACHWCHVMAHESFEDEDTAKIMNEFFVNIKVDREERPDLDKIYQTAHYYLTQSQGGWPLTVFLTPDDLTPFFSGTYFPKERRYQLPSFKEVLQTLADIYKTQPEDIKTQNDRLLAVLNEEPALTSSEAVSDKPFEIARNFLTKKFDAEYGGFGPAPKFPHPPILEFLLQEKSPMGEETLLKMAQGGIYDQVGGGFFRYSVDEKWEIPHFEKMLYDNAQLLYLYALAYTLFESSFFREVAEETAEWVLKIMHSSAGGYFTSLDADSEGMEGKYYIWNKFEIAETLTEKEFQFAEYYFGLSSAPNFEGEWHLHIAETLENTSEKMSISLDQGRPLLETIKIKLRDVRSKRTPPAKDTKILTAWNGLMIKSLLLTGRLLQDKRYIDSAFSTLSFIRQSLWIDNTLFVSFKEGKIGNSGFLDDYAFLLDSLLLALEISWDDDLLDWAIELANKLIKEFSDPKGGFYFTSHEQERIVFRPKTMMDEAIPSGNALATRSLITLSALLNDMEYFKIAEKTIQQVWPFLVRFPTEHANFLLTLKDYLTPPKHIIVKGPSAEILNWKKALPNGLQKTKLFFIPSESKALPHYKPQTDLTTAWVCEGQKCLPEITNMDEFKKIVNEFISP